MTAEQQLERSVLERKEREELRAIAQAMSLDTNSRSKKADIIDQILRAAGVEVSAGSANGGSGAPTRTRGATRRPASNGDSEDIELDDDATNGTRAGGESANGSPQSSSSASFAPPSSGGSQVDVPTSSDDSDDSDDSSDQTSGDQPSAERDGAGPAGDRATSTPRQAGGQNQNRQHTQQGGSANEPGNRRGRRRRGRERTTGGAGSERELCLLYTSPSPRDA